MTHTEARHDVVVVGGGAAGLSGAPDPRAGAAVGAGVDAGEQRNRPAEGVHGFLTRDGLAPGELVRLGRADVERYGGTVLDGRVTALAGRRGRLHRHARGRPLARRAAPARRDRPGRRAARCPRAARAVGHGRPALPVLPRLGGARRADRRARARARWRVHVTQLFRQSSADVTLFLHTAPAAVGRGGGGARGARHRGRRGRGRGARDRGRPAARRPPRERRGRAAPEARVSTRFVARAEPARRRRPDGDRAPARHRASGSRPTSPAGPRSRACGSRATSPT